MTNLDYFIKKYRNSDLLIDANLLIVLMVGETDINFLAKVKTTRAYTPEDYQLLLRIVKHFKLITTPHILAEVSNLCEKAEKFYKQKILLVFSRLVINLIETSWPSKEAVISPAFLKFGLTDSVIFNLARKGLVVLTDDFDLHSYLLGNGATAANMNLFRTDYLVK